MLGDYGMGPTKDTTRMLALEKSCCVLHFLRGTTESFHVGAVLAVAVAVAGCAEAAGVKALCGGVAVRLGVLNDKDDNDGPVTPSLLRRLFLSSRASVVSKLCEGEVKLLPLPLPLPCLLSSRAFLFACLRCQFR